MEVIDREDDLLRREGEKDVLAREVALDLREEILFHGEEDLAVPARRVEEEADRRIKNACKAAAEAVENAKAEACRATEEMETAKEEALRAAQDWRRRLDEAEGRIEELWIEREGAVSSISQISDKGWSAIVRAGLGERPFFPRSEQTLQNLVSSFRSIAVRLEDLPEVVRDLAAREGQDLADAVAEHVLACYRSWDPDFSLELASWRAVGQ